LSPIKTEKASAAMTRWQKAFGGALHGRGIIQDPFRSATKFSQQKASNLPDIA
jgi:hypothetical protein